MKSKINKLKSKIKAENLLLLSEEEQKSEYDLQKLYDWQEDYQWFDTISWEVFREDYWKCQHCGEYTDDWVCLCYTNK